MNNHHEPFAGVLSIILGITGGVLKWATITDTWLIQPLNHLLILFVLMCSGISGAYAVSPRFKNWFINYFNL